MILFLPDAQADKPFQQKVVKPDKRVNFTLGLACLEGWNGELGPRVSADIFKKTPAFWGVEVLVWRVPLAWKHLCPEFWLVKVAWHDP